MDKAKFLENIEYTSQEIEAASITVEELQSIHDDYVSSEKALRATGEMIVRLLSEFESVHSTRLRIKSSKSLVRKVIRKRMGSEKQGIKPRNINLENYREEIRDVIGLRALHLFKEDWGIISEAILGEWRMHPKEKTLAYLRVGDAPEHEQALRQAGFTVKKKDAGYRSLHFVIQAPSGKIPYYAEIQVRTLFEEAWSEIDHTVRYPDHEDDKLLRDYLLILNRLAGGADEMASLLLRVKAIQEAAELLEQERSFKDARISELQRKFDETVEKLGVTTEQAEELKRQLRDVSEVNEARYPSSLSRAAIEFVAQPTLGANTLAAIARMSSGTISTGISPALIEFIASGGHLPHRGALAMLATKARERQENNDED